MSLVETQVQILDKDLNLVAIPRALYPLNENGMIIRYTKLLSDYGTAEFRIATDDPLFDEFGDILIPNKYHIHIKRGNEVVWKGAIVRNPERNKRYISVMAVEYLFYLDKVLVDRTSQLSGSFSPDYELRIFNSGTLAAAVTAVVNEGKARLGDNHVLSGLTVGTVENPDFPNGYVKSDGTALTGSWTFSSNFSLQFSYDSVLFVLQTLGIYSLSDFEVTEDLTFNFKGFIGNTVRNISFVYDTRGNIIDYDLPRDGMRMLNSIWGVGFLTTGDVIQKEVRDSTSIDEYGLMEGVAAFSDVKNENALTTRTREELRFLKDPESSPINLVLDEKAYPLGQFDIGDIVDVRIKDGPIDYKGQRRIVGLSVNVHNTGREIITVRTNRPREGQ